MSDAEGYSIRQDVPLKSATEDSLDLSHVYPQWEHVITKVVETKGGHWDIYAENTEQYPNNSPDSLNYNACRIQGESASVMFQSGILAGKEFEIQQSETSLSGYDHKTKKFELVSQDINGQSMPNKNFAPVVGNTFRVFGVSLPDTYICDNNTQSGASWDMFREAAKYLYENSEQKFTFTGELDGIWAKKDWLNIGGRIKLGAYILFSDPQFQPEGIGIRIVGIKDFINNPHSPEIELSNSVVGSSIMSDIRKIESNEVVTETLHKDALQFSKRRYRDAVETMEMLNGALLDNFSGAINPITVKTMSMLIGDESLQFRFVDNKTTPNVVTHNVSYDKTTKILTCSSGIIQHMTLGIVTISSEHQASEYKFWTLPTFNTSVLTDPAKRYYLYAKVSKQEQSGVFDISDTAIAMEEVADYYHLLMGVLNSEYDGDRSYVSLYGYTEILPGQVTTDKIISSDNMSYIDFANNAFRVGNNDTYIDFNTLNDKKLRLKGTLMQSQSGFESYIPVFRGEYNSTAQYYEGDEVTYSASQTGKDTYRNIRESLGITPTNTEFWNVVAQGANGKDGAPGIGGADGVDGVDGVSIVFQGSFSSHPANPKNGWSYYNSTDKKCYVFQSGTWYQMTVDGVNGTNGVDGLSIVWKGDLKSPPVNPEINWAYRDTDNGVVYIYDGTSWVMMVMDGSDGVDGANGENGWSVYITYHDNPYDLTPTTPTGNGASSGWHTTPTAQSNWMSQKVAENADAGSWGAPILIVGKDGTYFEYRYAISGSTIVSPALNTADPNPDGWSISIPPISTFQYVWKTIGRKYSNGSWADDVYWSTPVLQSDRSTEGTTTLVSKGNYNEYTVYNGNRSEVNAVIHNGIFYISRVDAAQNGVFGNNTYTFSGKQPNNTQYWYPFGQSVENIATNLLLADNAYIADWIIKGGKLTSQRVIESNNSNLNGLPCAELNGNSGELIVRSFSNKDIFVNGEWEQLTSTNTVAVKSGSTENNANESVMVEARSSDGAVSQMNTQGFFTNQAGVRAVAPSTGITLLAGMAALGNGDLSRDVWSNNNTICGVYGDSYNSNATPCPSYGGYFRKLCANGLYLPTRYIDSSAWLGEYDVSVACCNTEWAGVFLPKNPYDGQYIRVRQVSGVKVDVYGENFIKIRRGSSSVDVVGMSNYYVFEFVFCREYNEWLMNYSNP